MQHAATEAGQLETSTGLDNRKLLMWLFLASECLFFGGLIATYLLYRNSAVTGPDRVDLFDIPFTSISSFVLLMSSVSMVLALAAIQRNDRRGTQIWLLATALLGMSFLAGQAFEFTEFYREGLTLSNSLFGTTFFVLTGFHGAHVSVGVLLLLSMSVMGSQGPVTERETLNIELMGLYWHFVDIVWIVIFTLIYLIQT